MERWISSSRLSIPVLGCLLLFVQASLQVCKRRCGTRLMEQGLCLMSVCMMSKYHYNVERLPCLWLVSPQKTVGWRVWT